MSSTGSTTGSEASARARGQLEILRQQYFALYPTYLLTYPSSEILVSEEGQGYLLSALLGLRLPGNTTPPSPSLPQPEDGYRKSFWRRIVTRLEAGVVASSSSSSSSGTRDDEIEVDERFYQVLASLMVSTPGQGMEMEAGPSVQRRRPKTSYRTFIYNRPPHFLSSRESTTTPPPLTGSATESHITLLEEQIAIQGGTTGLRTWTAALHLGHHLLHNPQTLFPDPHPEVLTRGAIELGAGTGFLSVLLGQLGVDVIATDLGDDSTSFEGCADDAEIEIEMDIGAGGAYTPLARLRANIALNDCTAKPVARALNWTEATLEPNLRPEIWDQLERERRIVLAADVIYDPDLVPPLVDAIDTLLSPDGENYALVSATVRNEQTFNLFLKTCIAHDLAIQQLVLPPVDPASPTFWDSALDAGTEVRIMRVTRMHP